MSICMVHSHTQIRHTPNDTIMSQRSGANRLTARRAPPTYTQSHSHRDLPLHEVYGRPPPPPERGSRQPPPYASQRRHTRARLVERVEQRFFPPPAYELPPEGYVDPVLLQREIQRLPEGDTRSTLQRMYDRFMYELLLFPSSLRTWGEAMMTEDLRDLSELVRGLLRRR